jgi:predicted amidohydrolase
LPDKRVFQKEKNIEKADIFIKEASEKAEVVALPEMWNCPYGNKYFKEYAEEENGRTVLFMSKAAAQTGFTLSEAPYLKSKTEKYITLHFVLTNVVT